MATPGRPADVECKQEQDGVNATPTRLPALANPIIRWSFQDPIGLW